MKHAKKRLTKAERVATAKALGEAVFLQYHSTSPADVAYAKAKIKSGLAAINPEAMQVMLRVIQQRKQEAAHLAELTADIENEKKAPADGK